MEEGWEGDNGEEIDRKIPMDFQCALNWFINKAEVLF